MEHKFEPFQKVLVRHNVKQEWDIAFYQRQIHGEAHRVIGRQFPVSYCIPYEGNEHLLGTTANPEPKHEYKWGDKVKYLTSYGKWIDALFISNREGNNRPKICLGESFLYVKKEDLKPVVEK